MNSFAPSYLPLAMGPDGQIPASDALLASDGIGAPFMPADPLAPAAFTITRPAQQTVPLVVCSPHSGHYYPPAFVAQSKLDAHTLRRSEDAHVQHLFADAPQVGAPLLCANFPRAYLDANREPYELDPAMFDGPLPAHANTRSPRVQAGLGTIARMVANGADIYRDRLSVTEAEQRIARCYRPYHAALGQLVEETCQSFGYCLVIDCHSMPSGLPVNGDTSRRRPLNDIVLGDCHGSSCARPLTALAHQILLENDLRVTRNTPYAGGFTTRHYGRPAQRVHALQIEISRHLYMNEATYQPRPAFDALRQIMHSLLTRLAALPADALLAAP
ncbi:N-formylglutamate amidohydrolase [Insolitispirillum peregrinum]|uniref:N-formylglutamate amidohydrolase n=1 Tax=Insolitispirillum peregrinum TaxID=80876 RepID=UPI003620C019